MTGRPWNLPPLSTLVAFEAAARHVSFKNASRELNVTPAAVSHQVKALERELRCALFARNHRGVELTETGAYLLVALQRGFEAMSDAMDQLRRRGARASVTIRATTAVSSFWLTPRLAEFWRAHGDVSVAQMLSDTDHLTDDCDLSIHYGNIAAARGERSILFHDQIMALGSPRLAERHNIRTAEDLAAAPLIHFDSEITLWPDWRGWFAKLGYTGPLKNSHRVNNYIIALEAARDDMGAVLGWMSLTKRFCEAGDLVPLLPDRIDMPEAFYIRLHPGAPERARLVYDWLVNGRSGG